MADDLSGDPPKTSPVDDLFGGDALDLEEPEPRSGGRRKISMARPQMSWVVIGVGALLLLIVFWYLSSAQREKFFVEVDDGMVTVERGMFFPFGASEWQPNRAYKPFALPAGVSPSATGAMTAEEADRVLFDLYMQIAERQVKDLDSGDPEIAEEMLLRANKLAFTTQKDDRRLLSMMGDVHFTRGISQIRGIQAQFDEALEQFRMAAQRGGVNYKGAAQWVEAIERLRSEFRILSERSGINPDEILAQPPRLGLKPKGGPAEGEVESEDGAPDAGPPDEE